MTTRLSNTPFLTVLDPIPKDNVGWTVQVYDGVSPNTLLAEVDRWTGMGFQDQLNDVGSGWVDINADDPVFTAALPAGATGTLLSKENLWRLYDDGVLRFSFFAEDLEVDVLREDGSRSTKITGRGQAKILEWATILPAGYPTYSKTNQDRLYGVANISKVALAGGVLTVTTASTLGVLVGDVVVLAEVSADDTLNGTYAVASVLSSTKFTVAKSATSSVTISHVYAAKVSAVMTGTITTNEAHGFIAGTAITVNVTSGNTSFNGAQTISKVPGTNTLSFLYGGAAFASAVAVGTVVGPKTLVSQDSSGSVTIGAPAMSAWLALFNEAKTRGCFPFASVTFGAATDSLLVPWADAAGVVVSPKGSLLELLATLTEKAGVDWHMTPGFRLAVSQTMGMNRSSTVRFFQTAHILDQGEKATSREVHSHIYAFDGNGGISGIADGAALVRYGRREGSVDASGAITAGHRDAVAAANLKQSKQAVRSIEVVVKQYDAGRRAWVDYGLGDTIGIDEKLLDGSNDYRVVGMGVEVDAERKSAVVLTLQSRLETALEQLRRRLARLLDSSSSAASSSSSSTASAASVAKAVASATLAGLSDVDLTGQNNYDVLTRRDGIWVSLPPDLTDGSIDSLYDVDTSTVVPTNGQTLIYDSVTGLWKPGTIAAGGGGLWSPDTLPTTPHAMDNEFTSALAGWTNIGTPDVLDANVTPSHLHMKVASSSPFNQWGIVKTAPAMPFTVTAKMTDSVLQQGYQGYGLVLAPATPGPLMTWTTLWHPSQAGTELVASNWASRTGGRSALAEYGQDREVNYIRMVVQTPTSVDLWWSRNGLAWAFIASGWNPGFTIAQVGLILSTHDNPVPLDGYFDWIRFSQP